MNLELRRHVRFDGLLNGLGCLGLRIRVVLFSLGSAGETDPVSFLGLICVFSIDSAILRVMIDTLTDD